MKAVKLWIWISALASLAGWSLSALGQLNRIGYAVFFSAALAIFFLCRHEPESSPSKRLSCRRKFTRRFRRPLPLMFALLAGLVFAGGALYPPSNFTGLNYHLARVLQWLAQGHWFWIHTPVCRMNYSGCAFEWITAPVVLFTRSDRFIFLVNFIPFLLLPGLVFSTFTRLGVSRRVAWQWMWLFPAGYNFLLQAGSIGNDAFSVVFVLAAIHFGCRAWESRRVGDLWLSLLAIALMTGTKPVSLPLLLPWLILVFKLHPLLLRRWLSSACVLILAAVASFLLIALMNRHYSGDWLGRPTEPLYKEVSQPLIGVLGNGVQFCLGNFSPPVFPQAMWWNQHSSSFLPDALGQAFDSNFWPGVLFIGELPTEDWSGIGFGAGLLLAVSVIASLRIRGFALQSSFSKPIPAWVRHSVVAAAWLSLLVFSCKSSLTTMARLIAPYYPLLLPALLLFAGQERVVRTRWWRSLTGVAMLLALVVLVLSPDRPLWPAQNTLSRFVAQCPDSPCALRALQVYRVYSRRNDALGAVRGLLPPDVKAVGFIGTLDDCDISLWRPFGERRVEHFLLDDPPGLIRQKVKYVVLGGSNLQSHGQTIERWLQNSGADLVAATNITVKVTEGAQPWYIARFKGD